MVEGGVGEGESIVLKSYGSGQSGGVEECWDRGGCVEGVWVWWGGNLFFFFFFWRGR